MSDGDFSNGLSNFSNDFVPKNPQKYICKNCDYNTSNKKDYDKHIKTIKHLSNGSQCLAMVKSPKIPKPYMCICGKSYADNSGLWRHKKRCIDNSTNCDNQMLTNLVLEVVKNNNDFQKQCAELQKQNQDLTNKLFEVCKGGNVTNNIIANTTNSNNKSFNLNFFLNETCKDAMNIMDFVDSLKLQISDLENIGKVGFVEGISSIIVKSLNSLDETKRPVHCTDTKREVMYVKDEDKWEKENDNKQRLRKAIKYIAHKNTKLLPEFRAKYPNCDKSESKLSGQYDKLVIEAFGGKGDNDAEKEDKIIRNIAKEVSIDK